MFAQADLTIAETDTPHSLWCDSGHNAPPTFRRNGPDTLPEPIKFFSVSGHNMNGTYCEPCLIVANHIARQKKLGNM